MLGYLPQEFSAFSKLTTGEFLDYSARLAGIESHDRRSDAVDKMLEKMGEKRELEKAKGLQIH